MIKRGQVVVEEVPAPQSSRGPCSSASMRSCISRRHRAERHPRQRHAALEARASSPSKVKKAGRQPDDAGRDRARAASRGKLAAGHPTGYSAAGDGDRSRRRRHDLDSATASPAPARSARTTPRSIRVPRNLWCRSPTASSFDEASTVTLGAIALQGVRRAQPTLGETFVVIGLGILGQLTAQLLRANGCRVIGVDLDRRRIDAGVATSAWTPSVHPDDGDAIAQVARLTDGIGADGVIITAATRVGRGRLDGVPDVPPEGTRRAGRRRRPEPEPRRLLPEGDRLLHLVLVRPGPLRRAATRRTASTIRSATSAGPRTATWREYLRLIGGRRGRGSSR